MTRIPLPGAPGEALMQGLNTGSSMFQRLMQPIMQRQALEQANVHHGQNLNVRQQQYDKLAQQFAERQALLQAAEDRRNEEFSLKKQLHPKNLDLLEAKYKKEMALADKAKQPADQNKATRAQQMTTPWVNMTSAQKENLSAFANALNIRPDVFTRGMLEGKSLEDVASEHGYDPEEVAKVLPKYLATSSNVTQENERQKNLAELNVIEERVTEWMAPYVRKVAGMSPKQVIDSFKGKDPHGLAKYYAALALQPEIAASRIKVMGGNMSHSGLEDIIKANFGKSRVSESQIGPEVYKLMNHYMGELLAEGSKAATQSLYGRSTQKTNSKKKERKPINQLKTIADIDDELAALDDEEDED